MNRRGFLASILAAGVAPAVVGSGILMPVRKLLVPDQRIDLSEEALEQALIDIQAMTDERGIALNVKSMMWPEIKAWYERAYPAKEWA